ncbi:MAG: Sua5 YciO YrdC YwlC family protein [Epsilonproteobacteria bacterium]|nr:Sua5 YciO YrdC YwlC family protein [Campylobacterota bacterium]
MKNLLFLTQTDTTIGFVSTDMKRIDEAKQRLDGKYYIKTLSSLSYLKAYSKVPNQHKNRIRRAKKTTFILKNSRSFRVIKDTQHNLLLDRLGSAYSSSANKSGEHFDKIYCEMVCDVVVSFPQNFNIAPASKILRLSHDFIKKIR